jgi:hypothetical protein
VNGSLGSMLGALTSLVDANGPGQSSAALPNGFAL